MGQTVLCKFLKAATLKQQMRKETSQNKKGRHAKEMNGLHLATER